MKGKEGTADPGGPDAKSGRYSSGSGLGPSGETGFFDDEASGIYSSRGFLVFHRSLEYSE